MICGIWRKKFADERKGGMRKGEDPWRSWEKNRESDFDKQRGEKIFREREK